MIVIITIKCLTLIWLHFNTYNYCYLRIFNPLVFKKKWLLLLLRTLLSLLLCVGPPWWRVTQRLPFQQLLHRCRVGTIPFPRFYLSLIHILRVKQGSIKCFVCVWLYLGLNPSLLAYWQTLKSLCQLVSSFLFRFSFWQSCGCRQLKCY